MRGLLIGMVRLYQWTLGAILGGHCRFYPSCSNYCIEAIETHGAWHGVRLGLCRLLKCHPFHPGGVDLVPPREEKTFAGHAGKLSA